MTNAGAAVVGIAVEVLPCTDVGLGVHYHEFVIPQHDVVAGLAIPALDCKFIAQI